MKIRGKNNIYNSYKKKKKRITIRIVSLTRYLPLFQLFPQKRNTCEVFRIFRSKRSNVKRLFLFKLQRREGKLG